MPATGQIESSQEINRIKSQVRQTLRERPQETMEWLWEAVDKDPVKFTAILYDWEGIHARPDQVEPDGDWSIWLVMAGRGWGKTRTAAEWVRKQIDQGIKRIALIGATAADARDVMVEGESGVLAVCPPYDKPVYEPSKRRVTWPSGAVATVFTADEPDRLRGPENEAAWCDEIATWRHVQEAWDNIAMGVRVGISRTIITTTPRPIKILRDMIKRDDVTMTRGRTHENLQNLSTSFRKQIMAQYEGTRIGRQELYGELLEDIPGALWSRKLIDSCKIEISDLPDMRRIVVGVDPAASSKETSDHTGIIVAGLGTDGLGYVLEDHSLRGTPARWAKAVTDAYYATEADKIIAEKNQGGEMVEHTLRSHDDALPIKLVSASRGKRTRAEPISALYEQGKVKHLRSNNLTQLEDEQCTWDGSGDSPDRMDACVWALTELMTGKKSSWGPA